MGIRRALLTVLLLSGAASLYAQQPQSGYEVYRQEVGDKMVLMRGRAAATYNFRCNGTQYWDSPEYKAGTLYYDGVRYDDVHLNIDAVRQDLLIKDPSTVAELMLERDKAERFTIAEKSFIVSRLLGPDAPEGYYEVLYDGKDKFVKQVRKVIETNTSGTGAVDIGEYSSGVASNVYEFFVRYKRYYVLKKDGSFTRVKNKKDLLRQYKSHKKQVKKYMKTEDPSSFEEYGALMMQFIEQ